MMARFAPLSTLWSGILHISAAGSSVTEIGGANLPLLFFVHLHISDGAGENPLPSQVSPVRHEET